MNKGQVMLIDSGDDSDGELIEQFLKKIGVPAKESENKSYTDLTKIEGLDLQNVEINQTGIIRRC